MKIAVLGSAPSSIGKAPFRDARYASWAQGKVESAVRAHGQIPGDWDIWGCSPGCWAVSPRFSRFFEVHRWEPGQPWFSPEYVQFLCNFAGIVYTGATIPEITNHVVYPIDRMEDKFSSYFMTSSLALMLALAIDTIEQVRAARDEVRLLKEGNAERIASGRPLLAENCFNPLPHGVSSDELGKPDESDVIGLWGVDMATDEEWSYQRPGCQFFILEAMRRGIGVYLPPESDLMRPMPVYGISEWDHNYIKLTSRARELSQKTKYHQQQIAEAQAQLGGIAGESGALTYFVNTWTSPYGMLPGMVIRQSPGTGLGSGITHFDGRPIERMNVPPAPEKVIMDAMVRPTEVDIEGLGTAATPVPLFGRQAPAAGDVDFKDAEKYSAKYKDLFIPDAAPPKITSTDDDTQSPGKDGLAGLSHDLGLT